MPCPVLLFHHNFSYWLPHKVHVVCWYKHRFIWSQIFSTVCYMPHTFHYIILLPFNILLLLIRKLSCFKFINKFKPLLDVYCGPYKDKYYYWTGLLLLMRTVFYGLSALDRWINLSCGTILLGILLCIQGVIHPFKCKLANIQESFILLDLHCIYVLANYSNNNSSVELNIVQLLIFVVFTYFFIFIICHCLISTCGKSIRKKISWITMLWKSNTAEIKKRSEILEINTVSSKNRSLH